MNEILRNNAILHLAKSMYASLINVITYALFFAALVSGHIILAFLVFLVFTVISGVSLIQMILFIKKIFQANKK